MSVCKKCYLWGDFADVLNGWPLSTLGQLVYADDCGFVTDTEKK